MYASAGELARWLGSLRAYAKLGPVEAAEADAAEKGIANVVFRTFQAARLQAAFGGTAGPVHEFDVDTAVAAAILTAQTVLALMG